MVTSDHSRCVMKLTSSDLFIHEDVVYELLVKQGRFYDKELLERLVKVFNTSLLRYSKVLFIRWDFKVGSYTHDNSEVSRLFKKLKIHLERKYGIKNTCYLWAREQEKTPHQHYHIVLLLNGHKIRHPYNLNRWLISYSERNDLPQPWVPQNCYKKLTRGDPDSFSEAFKRASYLAKSDGKGRQGKHCKNYGSSMI